MAGRIKRIARELTAQEAMAEADEPSRVWAGAAQVRGSAAQTNGDLRHDTHHQPGPTLVDPPAVPRRTPSRLPARPTNSYQQTVTTCEIVTRDTPKATYPEQFPRYVYRVLAAAEEGTPAAPG